MFGFVMTHYVKDKWYKNYLRFKAKHTPKGGYKPPIDDAYSSTNRTRDEYDIIVRLMTEEIAHLVPMAETRAKHAVCLDHIVPLSVGYFYDIPPEVIASVENLQILSFADNTRKGAKLTDRAKELLISWGYDPLNPPEIVTLQTGLCRQNEYTGFTVMGCPNLSLSDQSTRRRIEQKGRKYSRKAGKFSIS